MKEKMNVPRLRFNEFEEHWVKQALGQRMTIFRGASPRPKGDPRYYGGLVPRLMIQDATRDGKYTTPCIDFLTEEGAKKSRHLNAGSIVLSCSGTRVAIPTLLAVDACVHDGWLAFKDYKNIDPEYLYYLFVKLHERMQGSATTGGVFNNLTTEIMNNLMMSFPTLPEQQKIASFLSKVDERITLLTEKKAKLTEYKKGVMQQLFDGSFQEQDGKLVFVPPTLRFKADDGSDFPDWEEKTLGDVSDVRDGTHDSPTYVESGYPLITSKNLCVDGTIDYSNVSLISEEDYLQINRRSKVDIGDILFGMIGTIGNPVIVNMSGFAIKNVALIKQKSTILDNKFLIQYLASSSIAKQFYKLNTGGTQKFIALGVIRNLIVDIPCEEEQTKIANFLFVIDQKIELTNSELEKAKEWKMGLLQQMFV